MTPPLPVSMFLLVWSCFTAAWAEPSPSLTVAAVGDVMMGTDFPTNRLPDRKGSWLLEEAGRVLCRADVAFGNLEGVLCNGGISVKEPKEGRIYAFRTPTEFAPNLSEAGFNVLSLANNHSFDFGLDGLENSRDFLRRLGIQTSSKLGEVAEFNFRGITVGLVAFTTGPPPRSILDRAQALEEVRTLAPRYDILMVSVHAGIEGLQALHIADCNETFLDDPRGNLVRFARGAIEQGADLVIGHGPHVPRAMEVHQGRLIAYSLGNFCTYSGINVKEQRGFAPMVWVELEKTGFFRQGRVVSFRQYYETGPLPDPEKNAAKLLERLSHQDFPQTCPRFLKDGSFVPRKKGG